MVIYVSISLLMLQGFLLKKWFANGCQPSKLFVMGL